MNGGILCIGKGRLSGACAIGDDSVIVIYRGGALYKKRILQERKIEDDGIIAYAADGFVFPQGRLIMDSEVRYEAENK